MRVCLNFGLFHGFYFGIFHAIGDSAEAPTFSIGIFGQIHDEVQSCHRTSLAIALHRSRRLRDRSMTYISIWIVAKYVQKKQAQAREDIRCRLAL